MSETVIDPHETVTVERADGRSLSGSGVSEESLSQVVEKEPGPVVEPATDAPQPETKGRKRYSQLTSERDTALTQAQQAEALASELKNRLAILEAREAERSQRQQDPPTPPAQPEYSRPKPVATEIGAKYPDYESFVEDLSDWKSEQREIKLKQEFQTALETRIEAERSSVKQREASQSTLDRGRTAYPDFDAVVSSCTVQFPEAMLQAIAKMPNAEHIEYMLGKDPAWAAEVAASPDGLSLGLKIAERVPPAGRVPPASRPAVARTSQAPPPYEPVAGGSPTSATPLAELADRGDVEGYKARRASELRAAGVTAHR